MDELIKYYGVERSMPHGLRRKLSRLTKFLPEGAKIRQRLWHLINNTKSIPQCKICDSYVNWNKNNYNNFCSCKCAQRDSTTKDKIKNTLLTRYGVEHALQSSELLEKSKQTCLKNHGVTNPAQSLQIKEKIKQTCLSKFGVEYALQSNEVKEKAKQTMIERYDVEYALQSNEVKEKAKQTMIERYGVEKPLQSSDIQKKYKLTSLERYGVENASQLEEIKEKIKQSLIEKYGVENYNQRHISPDSLALLNNTEYLREQHHDKELTLTKIAEALGVSNGTVESRFKKFNIKIKHFSFSIGEREVLYYVQSLLSNTEILSNDRTIIAPYELDIYVPKYKFAIEYNGEYWHRNTQEKDSLKQKMCKNLNIKLITIWENQWNTSRETTKTLIMEEIIK